MAINLTPHQSEVLPIIDAISSRDFDGWFLRSSVFAVIQIESAFRQFARRYEPSIHDASYGYMQLLSGTARGLGYTGPVYPHMPSLEANSDGIAELPLDRIPGTLYDPEVNIGLGMKYLNDGWHHLQSAFGRDPTLSEWFAGYNEGYGAAARGRPDPAYVNVALAAFTHWLQTFNEVEAASSLIF